MFGPPRHQRKAIMTTEPSAASNSDNAQAVETPSDVGQPPAEITTVFFHGTRAELATGDLIRPGYHSNYGKRKIANYVYVTANLAVAIWGAELAVGESPERVYVVEPLGDVEDDPNVTDKRLPGNPTKSYRTLEPVRVVGEVINWHGHSPESLASMRSHLEQLKAAGIEHID